jgi:hypothetical protein
MQKVTTRVVPLHTEPMGLIDEKTVKQIFSELFDAPTADDVIKECTVVVPSFVKFILTDQLDVPRRSALQLLRKVTRRSCI